MPREVALPTERPFGEIELRAALALLPGEARAVAVDGGAALQVVVDGEPLLTLVRPRPVASAAEAARLLPGVVVPVADPVWWLEAVVPASADQIAADAFLAALAAT